MRLKTAILTAALLVAAPANALLAQGASPTKAEKEADATDYKKVYYEAVDDYNGNRNLEARLKFQKVLGKYPGHPQSMRYISLLDQRLRAEAAVPVQKRRLHSLLLKDASFEEATLAEVMDFIRLKAKELSKGAVKPGVVIRGGDVVRDRTLSLKIGDVPLDKLIDMVAGLTDTTVKYTDYAITLTPLPTPEEIAAQAEAQLQQGQAKEAGRAGENSNPFDKR